MHTTFILNVNNHLWEFISVYKVANFCEFVRLELYFLEVFEKRIVKAPLLNRTVTGAKAYRTSRINMIVQSYPD